MRTEQKQKRHEAIANAAYGLLAVKGYSGTSMLSIAKTAKASNETLYRWYGDKRGLFEALVRDNAEGIRTILEKAVEGDEAPSDTLQRVAPLLLAMLLGDRAILLNRAAAADPTGELGVAIAVGGRNVIQPLIAKLIKAVCRDQDADIDALADTFLGLLIGDLQIRRVIGVQRAFTEAELEMRCENALRAFFKLLEDG